MVGGGDIGATKYPLSFKEVRFVRYRNREDSRLHDVYWQKRDKPTGDDYFELPSDESEVVIYEYRFTHEAVKGEIRLSTTREEVIDLRTSRIAASYTSFTYSQFDPENMILGAPSLVTCPENVSKTDPSTGKRLPSNGELAFTEMFKR
jgi:hypothetical protein